MRSWNYLIALEGITKDGKKLEESALYIVAIPAEDILKAVEMECYASNYLPADAVLKYGQAYAIGVDHDIKDLDRYDISHYREDLGLYVFKEGVNFTDGLTNVFRLLLDMMKARESVDMVRPVVDVGSPPEEIMLMCLERSLST